MALVQWPFFSSSINQIKLETSMEDSIRYIIRQSLEWCQKSEDCSNADVLCNDMVTDHAAVLRMQQKYPEKFR